MLMTLATLVDADVFDLLACLMPMACGVGVPVSDLLSQSSW
ncbi:hypothetical protein [Bradyrhizobium algeriense]|nr:hypothetical protein [Bradyrhizobium algeriense]